MRIAKWAIGVALIGSLMAGAAWAQSVPGQELAADTAVEQAAYGYAEAGDAVVAPPSPTLASPSDGATTDNGADYYSGGDCGSCTDYGSCGSCASGSCGACMSCCSLGEVTRIFGKHEATGIEAGGWVSTGGLWNEHGTDLNGLGFNNLGDGINVHQLWLYAGKEADTQGCGWDWGARVDYVFGVDGADTQAFRGTQWDVDWNDGDYGSAIPQAYAEIAINYLTVKAGYFHTPIGYERVQAPENFFYSHSYAHYYLEPFTHTGALASYDGFKKFEFFGGWTVGWDTAFEKIGDSNMFLGGLKYSPDENVSVSYMTSVGRLDDLTIGQGDVYMHSIVMDMNLTDRLAWIIQGDFHHRDGQRNNVTAGGVNQYVKYKINDCWSLGGRFEWLYDRDGAFVQPGLASGNYYNLTAGVNWKPHANLIVRPEVRYDWYSGTHMPGGLPFDNNTNNEQFSGGLDVIVLF